MNPLQEHPFYWEYPPLKTFEDFFLLCFVFAFYRWVCTIVIIWIQYFKYIFIYIAENSFVKNGNIFPIDGPCFSKHLRFFLFYSNWQVVFETVKTVAVLYFFLIKRLTKKFFVPLSVVANIWMLLIIEVFLPRRRQESLRKITFRSVSTEKEVHLSTVSIYEPLMYSFFITEKQLVNLSYFKIYRFTYLQYI